MKHTTESRGREVVSEVAGILAAGFLRARLRKAEKFPGQLGQGLDVFEDVSIHCDRPVVKGGDR